MNLLGPYKYVVDALIIAALVGLLSFAVHKYNEHQQDIGEVRIQALWDKENLRRDIEKRAIEIANQKLVDDARIEGAKNVQIAQAAAAAAGNSSRVLGDTVKTILARSATESIEANRRYVAALAKVFNDCQERYRWMAERADGHAIDAMTCQAAWPTGVTK